MLTISEEYEWCWNFGTYFGAECELCPHRDECSAGGADDEEEDDVCKVDYR